MFLDPPQQFQGDFLTVSVNLVREMSLGTRLGKCLFVDKRTNSDSFKGHHFSPTTTDIPF